MAQLEGLRPDHGPKVLAFELANRTYFARFISDRGDAFFDEFSERFGALLAEIETGRYASFVLVDNEKSILGRFNLVDIDNDTAEIGYRVAERVAGHGVATAGVRQLCVLAGTRHGMRRLRARVSHENVASERVLSKAGFVADGEAEMEGRVGTWYERSL